MGIPTVKPVIADISSHSIAAQAQIEQNTQIMDGRWHKSERLGNH
ncbi:hypothetical protein AAUPMC_20481 [Pasteurella multocida subsp. multocida str. Anand1_cattle]|nr:hypothetical protein AAUPMC_20481 [Pasteurella multocida subsp. multocida str. Anand1_cattle]